MPVNPKSLSNLRPFEPGQSGNPEGRKSAGAYIKEWLNSLASLTLEEVAKVAKDKTAPAAKIIAAERILRAAEQPDLADFEGYATLKAARKAGLRTEAVKRLKIRKRDDGTTEREIELHDRAGADFDRMMDQTDGKPKQTTEVTVNLPQSVEFRTPGMSPAQDAECQT
jgi:hypothetical protein